MSVIYLLIGISLPLAMGFLIVFLRNAKLGQFDDLETPAMRILFEEKPKSQTEITSEEQPK
jgi:cbb3-type cytochrome oxidase maturation protein